MHVTEIVYKYATIEKIHDLIRQDVIGSLY